MDYDLWGQMLITIFFVIILLGINAFFAATEIAIISLNRAKINHQAEEGDKKARLLKKIIDEPSKFLATIQIGVTLSGFLLAAIVTIMYEPNLTKVFKKFDIPLISNYSSQISVAVLSLITTYVTLVFGELTPKNLGLNNSEKMARFSAGTINAFSKFASPFIKILTSSSNFISRLLGSDPHVTSVRITEEEIRMMINVGEEKGILLEQEKEMIDSIFEFDDTFVRTVMTPRTDMVCIPVNATLDEIITLTAKEKFSRLPVYEDSIDNIIGILNVKDLLEIFITNKDGEFDVKEYIRTPLFIPENQKTDILLKTLQEKRTELAIVIDEYGGTAGLVTTEDLVEEIVGSIMDEYDDEESEIEKIDYHTYIVDGILSISEINRELELVLPEEGADTIGGFILGLLGRIPENDEKPIINYENLIFEVEAIEDRRVTRIKIIISNEDDKNNENDEE